MGQFTDWAAEAKREDAEYRSAVASLSPADREAWAEVEAENEWFDGESAIANGALQRWLAGRTQPQTEKCRRCAGTGQFITYVENGVPKGPGGICFRCNGKGFQTKADSKRNWGYDNFYRRIDF